MKSSFSYELPIRPSIFLTEVSFITSRIKLFLGEVLGFLKNRSQAIFVLEILNIGPGDRTTKLEIDTTGNTKPIILVSIPLKRSSVQQIFTLFVFSFAPFPCKTYYPETGYYYILNLLYLLQ